MKFERIEMLIDRGFGIGWTISYTTKKVRKIHLSLYKWHFEVKFDA